MERPPIFRGIDKELCFFTKERELKPIGYTKNDGISPDILTAMQPFHVGIVQYRDISLSFGRAMLLALKSGYVKKPDDLFEIHPCRMPVVTPFEKTIKGLYLALEFKSACYRITLMVFSEKSKVPQTLETTGFVPIEAMTSTGTELFESIATTVKDFLIKYNYLPGEGAPMRMGFIFGFPAVWEDGMKTVRLSHWNRGFSSKGVVGQNVRELLQNALVEKELNIQVMAVLEEAMGILMFGAYCEENCLIGVNLGYSTRAAYIESQIEIPEVGCSEFRSKDVITLDWSTMGMNDPVLDICWTHYDEKLFDLEFKGKILDDKKKFERMTSFYVVAELIRIILLNMTERGVLFGGNVPRRLLKPKSINSQIFIVLAKECNVVVHELQYLITQELSVDVVTPQDAINVHYIAQVLIARAGYLVGAGIVAILNRLKKQDFSNVTVAVGGPFFLYSECIYHRIREVTDQLKHRNTQYILKYMEDGGCRGAATIAALLPD